MIIKLKIIWAILKERKHQDDVWGGKYHDRTHTPGTWSGILENYLGKYEIAPDYEEEQRRLIQIAAICMAILECDK